MDMKSEAQKIAQINADHDLMVEILRNPIVELMAGTYLIGKMNGGGLAGNVGALIEDAGLVALIGLQQLGGEGVQQISGTSGALSTLGKVIPLLK
jgi:hypothetical protein